MIWLAMLFVVALAAPARAQSFEVAPFGGVTNATTIDTTTVNVEDLQIDGGWVYGVSATYFVTSRLGVEGLFAQQPTHVGMTVGGVSAPAFAMKITHVLGNVVFQPVSGGTRLAPFVFGGLGTTIMTARDVEQSSHLAWNVGGGLKWFWSTGVGLRVHARYSGTRLNGADAEVCGPFGFCEDALPRFEVAAGVVLKF